MDRASAGERADEGERIGWRRARAFAHGATRLGASGPHRPARARPRSHDHGPDCSFFLGGIGGPAFSRSLDGRFDRWQLEPGKLARVPIAAAGLAIRWRDGPGRPGFRRIETGRGPSRFAPNTRRIAALFPFQIEVYDDPALPFSLEIESFSPVIPGDETTSALPVSLFTVRARPRSNRPIEIGIVFFWPNLLGWSLSPITTAKRRLPLWPNQGHAGLIHRDGPETRDRRVVIQSRETIHSSEPLSGEIGLAVEAPGWRCDRALAFKTDGNAIGRPYAEQRLTLGHVLSSFRRGEGFAGYDRAWQAHWHEPLGSALAVHRRLEGEPAEACFALALDIPVIRFGMGRRWLRRYARDWEKAGRVGADLASHALDRRREWAARIDTFQEDTIRRAEAAGAPAGALINALAFLTGGGTAWLDRPIDRPPTSCFGAEGHFGLLEGFDSGYYYLNTLDLWIHAFTAITRTYPGLAESVFADYLDTVEHEEAAERPIYRTESWAPMLVSGKLPHDLGCPAEDPWVRLNGYVMRDDPNLWKDHNPGFIIAFYLHRRMTGTPITGRDYAALAAAADFVAAQDEGDDGAPAHSDFGDSTWDNLDIRGHSAAATGLCLAAWAALVRLAEAHGDQARIRLAVHKQARAAQTLAALWTGSHYRCASAGKYREAASSDALTGPLYARRAGLGDLVEPDRARRHLATVLELNFEAAGGKAGPLLVAERGRTQYGRDGGEELQVNEVIVGAAWILAACCREWGLAREARVVEKALVRTEAAYGLQFRSPAAWTADGRFRAPLNMRPLAIWGILP
jgi:non-lysosomal glucosylceramidase